VGAPVIILRSLDPPKVTNGTRCIITSLSRNVINARISSGRYIRKEITIPRISLIPSDSTLPFQFRHLQFPVSLCIAMTINKSQGQSLKAVGINLTSQCFTLYVALSRVGMPQSVTSLIKEDNKTRNVVYKETLQ